MPVALAGIAPPAKHLQIIKCKLQVWPVSQGNDVVNVNLSLVIATAHTGPAVMPKHLPAQFPPLSWWLLSFECHFPPQSTLLALSLALCVHSAHFQRLLRPPLLMIHVPPPTFLLD